MGTRGTFGFRLNGKDKLSYNHSDSHPSSLGVQVLTDIRSLIADSGMTYIKARVNALRMIDSNKDKPTTKDIENLAPYTNLTVSKQSTKDWYCLMRELQGEIKTTLEAGYMMENNTFINDSLFCEWGYIINLDDDTLEVYCGFQHSAHNLGRYADNLGNAGYFPCALIAVFQLDALPDNEEFLNAIVPEEEEIA